MDDNKLRNVVFVMIGAPGSGKSTYAKKLRGANSAVYISRDEIRFSLMNEGDAFFSNEHQVYQEFTYEILKAISENKNVIIDATHLTKKSRQKLFNAIHIDKNKTSVAAFYMDTPLDICIKRNETRKGTKTYVPPAELRRMFFRLEPPSYQEYNQIFDMIYQVFYTGAVKKLERR